MARFRMRSVCGCIVCDHINLHFESPLRWLSLSLRTPSFPSTDLAPSTVSLLFAPRDRFRRSVPIKAAAYCIQIGSRLFSPFAVFYSSLLLRSAAVVTSLPLARSLSFIRRSCKILRFRPTNHPSCGASSCRHGCRIV